MTMRLRLAGVAVVAACHPAPGGVAGASHIDKPASVYDAASEHARRGDREGALALLERLDASGWSFCPADRDMPGLVDLPRYRALCERMKHRAPRVARATVAMTLADSELAPEGIAYDEAHRAVFVGSIAERKILRIGGDGEPRDFATAAAGLYGVLGLRVDAPHGRLWAATTALPNMAGFSAGDAGKVALFALDLDTGAVREQWTLRDGHSHLFNDVAVAADGTAYVTDSAAGTVWRHRPGDPDLTPLLAPGALRFPNGIACDGESVLVAHSDGIAVVTPLARRELAVPAGATLGGLDGLYLDGDVVFGVQNGFGSSRIVRAELDAQHARVVRITVLESAHPALEVPTTAALVREERRLLVIVPGDARPTVILAVPIDP
jgi:sugar lactone lactonase YvrE